MLTSIQEDGESENKGEYTFLSVPASPYSPHESEVSSPGRMGRKVLSQPALNTLVSQADRAEKKSSSLMRRVKSEPTLGLSRLEFELYKETPFLALPGIGVRVNSFYQTLEERSQAALTEGGESIEGPLTTAFEDRTTSYLLWCVFQGLLQALNYGFNISILNVPKEHITGDLGLNDTQFSSLNSSFCLAGVFGAFFAGWFSERFGRKAFLLFNDLLWTAAGLLFYKTESYLYCLIGRCIIGFAGGGATCVVPTYLGEISPTRVRGTIGSLNQLCICFGILVSEALAKKGWLLDDWKLLLALTAVPAVFQLLTFWSFPETPPYLISKDQIEEGTMVLKKLRQHDDVDWEVSAISRSMQGTKRSMTADKQQHLLVFDDPVENDSTISRLRKNTGLRMGFLIACLLMVSQQFSGINSIFFYSATIFKNAHVPAWSGSVIVGGANFLSVFIAIPLVDSLGRRFCLQTSCAIMSMAAIGVSVCLYFGHKESDVEYWQYLTIAFLMVYVIGFEVGLGPIPWLIVAEMIPTKDLSFIMGVASGVNGISNFCIAQFFVTLDKLLHHYLVYGPFFVVLVITFIYVTAIVPETRGLRVEQVQKILSGKVENEADEHDFS